MSFYIFFKVETFGFSILFLSAIAALSLRRIYIRLSVEIDDFCSKLDGLLSVLICADFRHNRKETKGKYPAGCFLFVMKCASRT